MPSAYYLFHFIFLQLRKIREEGNMRAQELFTISLSAYLFLSSFGILAGSSRSPSCPPSSCGNLRDIRYPFRLAGDPETCGMREYELVCEGNRTVLNWLSGKYYVLNFTYESQLIRVVDVSLDGGSCSLPSQSLSSRSVDDDRRYRVYSPRGAFVNCSRKIDNAVYAPIACMSWEGTRSVWCVEDDLFAVYEPVACMSRKGTHVYLVHGRFGDELQFLQPSCHALSLIPLAVGEEKALVSGAAEALQMGFEMKWTQGIGSISKAGIVRMCWRYAFGLFLQRVREGKIFWSHLELERDFHDCLQSNFFQAPRVDVGYAVVLTVLLGVLHLLIVLILVGRFVVAPMSIFVSLIIKFREEHASIDTVEKFLRNQKMLAPARYTYPEILSITNHFEKKLGEGGFGSVYQGKLPGDYLVAVKMLSDSKCNGEDFINEVSTIGRIHHVNVLRLIGFCSEGAKRALMYEYMPNGSLDRYIFPSMGANSSLSLDKLCDIAMGIARGVEYLHGGCDMCILHFDIKPQNILLDHNFSPKVSDFGQAKLYPKDYSLVSVSAVRGTIGYIAPELVSRNFGTVSYKSDVYSFGMLLLEMVGAHTKVNLEGSNEIYFPAWIYDRLCEEEVVEQDGVAEIGEVERKLCIVGLWCIQMKPSDRPSTSRVIEMLEGSAHTLPIPPKPFFSSSRSMAAVESCMNTSVEELYVISEV